MLEVGVNSYITIEGANDIVKKHLDKYNGLRSFWEILEDEEKEMYLIRAVEEMETVSFVGRKYRPTQALQFPRAPFEEVPYEIKLAQVYNALGCLNNDIKDLASETNKLYARYGVYIGENTDKNGAISNDTHNSRHIVLSSTKATKIAKKYARGAFRMR